MHLKNPLKRSLEDLRKSKYSLTRWESINIRISFIGFFTKKKLAAIEKKLSILYKTPIVIVAFSNNSLVYKGITISQRGAETVVCIIFTKSIIINSNEKPEKDVFITLFVTVLEGAKVFSSIDIVQERINEKILNNPIIIKTILF